MREPGRNLPVINNFDVAVVGGGIAGAAAALAAVKLGARTCLIEKYSALGGLATLANVVICLPICDGEGRQVIGGLGEALLRLAAEDGYDEIPGVWNSPHSVQERIHQRFMLRLNAPSYILALEKELLDAGVHLWYDTLFSDVIADEDRIKAVIVQNKSGRMAMQAGVFVDASGDADLCFAGGEETAVLDSNVRSNWFFYHDSNGIHLSSLSDPFTADGFYSAAPRGYSGVKGKDVSSHIIDSHQMLREHFVEIKKTKPEAVLVNIPTMPSFRMTRRLQGEHVLSELDSGTSPEDLVGLCPSWREDGIVYGIPYRSLRGTCNKNLITAGRCISASGRLWDLTRVIPVCALTGEIAGTAAALAVDSQEGNLHSLPVENLRRQLINQGNILDASLIRGC